MQKIYITGPVGSGKSTLARRLAYVCGQTAYEMDNVIHKPNPDAPGSNMKRSVEERDALFAEILSQDAWIMEDTGRTLFEEAWRQADMIVLLVPPLRTRLFRIVTRWIKQNLGLESCEYKPNFWMLKIMFLWTKRFERGEDNLLARLIPYQNKVLRLRTNREVDQFIKTCCEGGEHAIQHNSL